MVSFLNAAVPGGIGGLFIGPDRRLKVYIRDLSRQADARTQLINIQRPQPRGGLRFQAGDIDFLQADYDWDELRTWYDQLANLPLDGLVHEYDIDESLNRIRLVVASTADQQAVLQLLTTSPSLVPDAFLVETEPRAVSLARPAAAAAVSPDSLTHTDNPVRGAFEIHGGAGRCTITANTEFDSTKKGFLTASHCTTEWGDDSPPDSAFQSADTGAGGRVVADEDEDPAFLSSEEYPSCPTSQYRCRYTDAVMFEYRADSLPRHGIIARAELGSPALETPDCHIQDDDPVCPWVEWCTMQGDSIYKVGKRTGLTGGTIEGVCVKHEPTGPGGLERWFLCSERVEGNNGIAGGGDSGAPVIVIDSPGNADLWGILFAANDSTPSSTHTYWFSRIDNVRLEVKDFNTVDDWGGGPESRVPGRVRRVERERVP